MRPPSRTLRAATIGALTVDLALICTFAAAGRRSHQEHGPISSTLVVAAPFVLGWLVGAAAVRLPRLPLSPARAGRALLVALPLALTLRAVVFDRAVPLAFMLVAAGFLLTALSGWRLLLSLFAGRPS